MTKIKICGLTRPEDIDYVNQFMPDYIGFVFWEKSKRAVTKEQAAKLRANLHPDICPVGVFVDEDPDQIIQLLQEGIIEMAQLHGNETEEQIIHIQTCTGKPVIKAIQVKDQEDVRKWQNSQARYLLLDAGMGQGETFDWSLISQMNRPFFLAGGLGADNVAEAITRTKPYAVDVSSKVETEGRKDPHKIQEFIRRVRHE